MLLLILKTSLAQKNRSIVSKVLNYRIPIYQVAAGILLFMLATWAISNVRNDKNLPPGITNEVMAGKSLADDDYPEDLIFDL